MLGVEFCATLDDRTTEMCQSRHGLVMRLDDPRLAYNTPPLHPNCRSMLLSATVYDHPDGLLTSHEFDNVPDGIQRPEDVEEVQKILEGSGAKTAASVDEQIRSFVKEGVTTAKGAEELGNLVYNEAKRAMEAEGKAEKLLEYLSKYREFGSKVPDYAELPSLKSDEAAKALVNDALRFYPSAWAAAAFAERDVSARLTDFATDKGQSHLAIRSIRETESGETKTRRVYELVVREDDEDGAKGLTAQLMELKIPTILRLEKEFYEAWLEGQVKDPMREILPNLSKPRDNDGKNLEILSAGMMCVFNNLKDVWNKGRKFTKFILGLLLGAQTHLTP